MEQNIKYKDPITIIFPDMVARVYSPMLTQGEREKRMQTIHKATAKIFEGAKK